MTCTGACGHLGLGKPLNIRLQPKQKQAAAMLHEAPVLPYLPNVDSVCEKLAQY
jgi:hypothetical protein